MQPLQLAFDISNLPKHLVLGGDLPLVDILGSFYLKPFMQQYLKRYSFMFLSQFTTLDGQFLLKWADLRITYARASRTEPKWYSSMEHHTLLAHDE